jgi:hypothetical protein
VRKTIKEIVKTMKGINLPIIATFAASLLTEPTVVSVGACPSMSVAEAIRRRLKLADGRILIRASSRPRSRFCPTEGCWLVGGDDGSGVGITDTDLFAP